MLARLVVLLLSPSIAIVQRHLKHDLQTAPAHADEDLSVVHVAYATTPDGFPGLLYSMISVARNLGAGQQCRIHVIVAEDHIARAREVLACLERDVSGLPATTTASLHVMPALPWDTSLMRTSSEGLARSWGHSDKLSQPTVFARFYLHQILSDLPRVLWLDVDTIVCADLTPLYNTEMDHPIAARAIKEVTVHHDFPSWSCTKHLDQQHKFTSFNTGVMVLDLNKWRKGNYTHQLEQTAADCVTNDQPTFNIVFMDNVQYFAKTWNSFALGSTVKARTKRVANILHWSGPTKPWSEPAKCNDPEARKEDTDCLSAENHADYEKYGPRETCRAI